MNAFSPRLRIARDERDWAAAPHALFGLCLLIGTFTGWPLIALSLAFAAWLAWTSRNTRPFVARHARESLNLQCTLVVVYLAAAFVKLSTARPDKPLWLITVVIASFFGALWLTWIASERAAKGFDYRIRLAIRFLR